MTTGLRTGPLTSGGRRREGLSATARTQLAAAHDLVKQGKDAEAADAFAHVAGKLAERGDHVVALHLQVEAARAMNRAGRTDDAVDAAGTAIAYALQGQQRQKATRKLAAVVYELRDADHAEAADALEATTKERVGSLPARDDLAAPTINRAMRRSLPKSCPTCGLKVDPEKLEVSDDALADCGWCGAPVTG